MLKSLRKEIRHINTASLKKISAVMVEHGVKVNLKMWQVGMLNSLEMMS